MLLIVKYNAIMQCKYRMRTLFFQNGIFAATLFIRSFYTHRIIFIIYHIIIYQKFIIVSRKKNKLKFIFVLIKKK